MSASPRAAYALTQMNGPIDTRHVLSAVSAPTLVIHRSGDRALPVEGARYLAERIEGAKLAELPGDDHLPFVGNQDEILDEVEEFLMGVRRGPAPDRVLATVLFTDVVGSTEPACGARRPRLEGPARASPCACEARARALARLGGGHCRRRLSRDFRRPGRAIRCACAVRDAVRELGLDIRAGLHTGECEVLGSTVAGIAAHIGARVSALAGGGEVLVSSTVKDLVAGSGIAFCERGEHVLKGVPEPWRIYAVEGV